MKNRITIGTASIVLIFIILCLAVFCLLGLSDAKSAGLFAERYADSVTAYYQADMAGQHFIKAVRDALEDGSSLEDAGEDAAAALPEGTALETGSDGRLICEIPMSAGQALHIELRESGGSVPAYYVYNKEEYAIDDRLPVWDGAEN